jgi:hypothetical protein
MKTRKKIAQNYKKTREIARKIRKSKSYAAQERKEHDFKPVGHPSGRIT